MKQDLDLDFQLLKCKVYIKGSALIIMRAYMAYLTFCTIQQTHHARRDGGHGGGRFGD